MTAQVTEPYRTRPVRCLEVWVTDGWRVKVYGIAYRRDRPRPELVEAAKEVAARTLPRPAEADDRYGMGFLGVHDARGCCVVFVSWWADENELQHEVFMSPDDRPAELAYGGPNGSLACVWELAVMAFERRAWLEAVLGNADGPDLDGYLALQLNEDV